MTIQEQIEIENDLLRTELGVRPLYAWKHSKTLFFRVQKIVTSSTAANGVEPQYEYRANPATGLIELSPIYVDMPMLPILPDSWLLCRHVPADQEAVFRQKFGTRVEYPAGGVWQPIQITALRPGVIPSRTDTWNMVRAVRQNAIAVREFFDGAEERQNKQEKRDAANFGQMARDKFTAFMEVPGKKGATSFPTNKEIN